MLRDLALKSVYKSDTDNILVEFYVPALSLASRYDRAVGFFSAAALNYAAQALSNFVKNDGQIRLVLGAFCDQDDLDAVLEGYRLKEISEQLGRELLAQISSVSDALFQNRIETLAWLVAHGRLEVKIALRPNGMYHDKIGIITDALGDAIVFAGSANESLHALLPAYNYESIDVFPSWKSELAGYYEPHAQSFERLWANKSRGTAVLDIPAAVKDHLVALSRSLDYVPDPDFELALATRVSLGQEGPERQSMRPTEPLTINGQPYSIRPHQLDALENWRAKGAFHGILDLATGAGKTVTAIHAIVKLAEKVKGLVCVIAVPYQNLADQWCDILSAYNIFPIRCYVSKDQWSDALRVAIHETNIGARAFTAVVVVNRTLKTPEFQECLSQIKPNKLFWIGDECHHHGGASFATALPQNADFRLGLSATPDHYLDQSRNQRLQSYYGDQVFHYTLSQAITDKVLTPYSYYPHVIELTFDETAEFFALSAEIGKLFAKGNNGAEELSTPLKALLMRRSRLIASCANKLPVLARLVQAQGPTGHTLFYCGDGSVENDDDADNVFEQRQIEAVSELLDGAGWDISRFTSREPRKDRATILENFRVGVIDAMVAIRCLDEGIDVPACATAFILASSRDPRQFVQRRGRILRRAPGKDRATIHDFIVVVPESVGEHEEYAKRLIVDELKRVAEFAKLSDNRYGAYDVLRDTLRRYDLEHVL
ncbi:DEAD/DEAH box helicase family protein [Rhizobium indigoferae]|uniref:DEAD/DEAH box helicase family protein n=1 Tax=Rhizobium indigoferae TaxID=158891 RepID=A0ABZ1DRW4_9HYPH|nr:DEAD/DEAH box helicase family protein [Rhizobium indigoferae]NNU57017.1 DEAD/DEAH box helicase family protein [Rhizobium indigoferae]WRW37695.1 DEAD/DEAH box helicase family protein [Rhizobium indigoferae]GLR60297.1 DNA-repair protein [Rhizobium indigoferae]